MTLLEMIKKYEDAKSRLEAMHLKLSPTTDNLRSIVNDVAVADAILEDLKSIRDQQPSWVTLRVKVLERIDKAINLDDPDGAQTWTHVLSMLPK
jgi:radical SAM superfamily enzyme